MSSAEYGVRGFRHIEMPVNKIGNKSVISLHNPNFISEEHMKIFLLKKWKILTSNIFNKGFLNDITLSDFEATGLPDGKTKFKGRVDLVGIDKPLLSYVLIELKNGSINDAAIHQLEGYVRTAQEQNINRYGILIGHSITEHSRETLHGSKIPMRIALLKSYDELDNMGLEASFIYLKDLFEEAEVPDGNPAFYETEQTIKSQTKNDCKVVFPSET